MCKKCKKVVTIATGDPTLMIDGAPIARAGDVTTCGSKLIANQQALAESDFEVGNIQPSEKMQSNFNENDYKSAKENIYADKFQITDKLIF